MATNSNQLHLKINKNLYAPLIQDLESYFPLHSQSKIASVAIFYMWCCVFEKINGETRYQALLKHFGWEDNPAAHAKEVFKRFEKEGYAYLSKLK